MQFLIETSMSFHFQTLWQKQLGINDTTCLSLIKSYQVFLTLPVGLPPEIDTTPTQTSQWWLKNFLRMRKDLYGKVFRIRGKVLRLYGRVFHLYGKAFRWVFSPSLLFSVWKQESYANQPKKSVFHLFNLWFFKENHPKLFFYPSLIVLFYILFSFAVTC